MDVLGDKGRILCVTSNFPRWPGDSTTPFVLHLAQDLQERGWRVDILAPNAEQETAAEETIGGVHVERFNYLWPRRMQTVCYHGGALINLRSKRGNLLKLPALVAAEWAAVLRRLASRRYDLLHTHWILPQGFTGVLAAKPLRIPHVLTVHGGDVFALKGGLLQHFKRFSLSNADAVTVNSSATQIAVEAIASDLPNLRRIPMGVGISAVATADPRVIDIRHRYRRGGGPLLVFVGRVVEEKGVEDVLKAVLHLRASHPDTTALIVGEGQHRQQFENMTKSLGLESQVTFTGWVQPDSIPAYLAAGDVFVGPSWHEAQGLTFIEAMVARTPVVASRVGGIVDSVIDGQTGLLVDERAPEQIAQAVERLMSDAGLKTHLVNTAYASAVEKFSREASAQAFSSLFSELVTLRQEAK